ncbi:hypothetical protein C8F01DRAFT_1261478 [Mycena amicta]|nr:hypothetical protein C8F01DRAFT_1261478 [Mycena amicta]
MPEARGERAVCRPRFYAGAGLEHLKRDPHAAVSFYVVLSGALPGAYTSRDLVEAKSEGKPFFCLHIVSWHEVLRIWAAQCLYHHRHDNDSTTSRWMRITLREPLHHPPHPPPPPESSPSTPESLHIELDESYLSTEYFIPARPRAKPSTEASPSSSLAASNMDSNDEASFEAHSFSTWRSTLPTPSPPSSDPGAVLYEDFSHAIRHIESAVAQPVTTTWYEIEMHRRFRSWPDLIRYLSQLEVPVDGEMKIRSYSGELKNGKQMCKTISVRYYHTLGRPVQITTPILHTPGFRTNHNDFIAIDNILGGYRVQPRVHEIYVGVDYCDDRGFHTEEYMAFYKNHDQLPYNLHLDIKGELAIVRKSEGGPVNLRMCDRRVADFIAVSLQAAINKIQHHRAPKRPLIKILSMPKDYRSAWL